MKLRTLLLALLASGALLGSCAVGFGLSSLGGAAHVSAPHVKVLHLDGMITDPTRLAEKLREAREDSSVKAVILRIESPGGAVGASQELYRSMLLLSAVKPTVASICNLGASGGYYTALGATRIMANPGSLTASIGVISQFTDAHELLEKVGVKMETVKSGELKDAGSPFRGMSETDRRHFQSVIDDVYRQFRADVRTRRKVDSAALDTLADGRVLSGAQARAAGLVDTLGGFEEARALALALAKLPVDAPVVDDAPKGSFLRRLLEQEAEGISRMLPTSESPVQFRMR